MPYQEQMNMMALGKCVNDVVGNIKLQKEQINMTEHLQCNNGPLYIKGEKSKK